MEIPDFDCMVALKMSARDPGRPVDHRWTSKWNSKLSSGRREIVLRPVAKQQAEPSPQQNRWRFREQVDAVCEAALGWVVCAFVGFLGSHMMAMVGMFTKEMASGSRVSSEYYLPFVIVAANLAGLVGYFRTTEFDFGFSRFKWFWLLTVLWLSFVWGFSIFLLM